MHFIINIHCFLLCLSITKENEENIIISVDRDGPQNKIQMRPAQYSTEAKILERNNNWFSIL